MIRIRLRAAPVSLALGLALAALVPAPVPAQDAPPYVVRQLSPSGPPASRVGGVTMIDPRGEWVVFTGDVELVGLEAIYAMRRHGTRLHRLSTYFPQGTSLSIKFSSDGRRVLYVGDLEVDGRFELWSIRLDEPPEAAVKLNVPVIGPGVTFFEVPKVGDRVAYIAQTASGPQVWSVLAAGPAGSNSLISPPAEANEAIQWLIARPDGAEIAIQYVDFGPPAAGRIVTAPITGPPAAADVLAESTPGGCALLASEFSADSSRLLYGGQCTGPSGTYNNQIWSVPANGPAGDAVSLGGAFVADGSVHSILISPDGQRVVFSADRLVDERTELFSVPILGPAAALVRLNQAPVSGGDVIGFQISPDSSRVAYIADETSDERFFPWSAPIAGPESQRVVLYQGILMTGADATDLAFTPDSSRVVFRFDLAVDGRFDLYSAPADGSAAQARITNRGSNPAPERWVQSLWRIHPDGERVLYTFAETAGGTRRGLGEQRIVDPYEADLRLNGVPVAGGTLDHFFLFPGGEGILYRSDEVVDGKLEVFTVELRIFGDGFELGDSRAWGDQP